MKDVRRKDSPSDGKLPAGNLYFILTLLMLLFFLVQNGIYRDLDNLWLNTGDSHWHLAMACDTYKTLAKSGVWAYLSEHPSDFYHPPSVYLLSALFFQLMGVSINTAITSQGIYWIILVFSAFFICRKYTGPEGGFIGALMIMGIPYLGKCGRDYCLDLPLTAMIALFFALLQQSDDFRLGGYTYGSFAAMALGTYTKATAPLYMAIPFLLTVTPLFLSRFKEIDQNEKKRLVNCLIFLAAASGAAYLNGAYLFPKLFPGEALDALRWLLAFLSSAGFFILAAVHVAKLGKIPGDPLKNCLYGIIIYWVLLWPYYGYHFNSIYSQTAYLTGAGRGPDGLWTTADKLIFSTFGFPLSCFFIAGLTLTTVNYFKFRNRPHMIFAVSAAGGILLVSLMPVRDYRFYLPLSVYIATTAVTGLMRMRNVPARGVAVAAMAYFSLTGFAGWLSPNSPLNVPLETLVSISGSGSSMARPFALTTPPPSRDGFDTEGIYQAVKTASTGKRWSLLLSVQGENEAYALSRGIQIQALFTDGIRLHGASESFTPAPPPAEEEGFSYLHMAPVTPDIPDEKKVLMAVILEPAEKNSLLIPTALRRGLIKAGLNFRPDVQVILEEKPCSGGKMRMRLLRIPLRR